MINTAPLVSYLHVIATAGAVGLVIGTSLAYVAWFAVRRYGMSRRMQVRLAGGAFAFVAFVVPAFCWFAISH